MNEPPFQQSNYIENGKDILNNSVNMTELRLPFWIDSLLFNDLGASYNPSHERFAYNLDSSKEECKVYLGTYYPRSFAEWFMIFDCLLQDKTLLSSLVEHGKVRILDFGCGTGGECLGLISAFERHTSQPLIFEIIGIDGNHQALRLFESIIGHYNSLGRNQISLSVAPVMIESGDDLNMLSELIGQDFDFIITSKALGELESRRRLDRNAYEFFAELFAPYVAKTGMMIILDVTTKSKINEMYLSQRMNQGINLFIASHPNYKSLAPCTGMTQQGQCNNNCFYKKEIHISHSRKSNDISKFALRIIVPQTYQFTDFYITQIFKNYNCVN